MYHKERIDLIVRCMVLPFCDERFLKKDYLLDVGTAYYNLCKKRNNPDYNNYKKVYQKAKQAIENLFIDDLRQINLDDITMIFELFFPREDIARCLENNRIIEWLYFDHLLDLANMFVTMRDGSLSIKTVERRHEPFKGFKGFNKVELWQTLTRIMTPDIIMISYFIDVPMEDMEYLVNIPNVLPLSDLPLRKILDEGVAETHLHFNAGVIYVKVWETVMNFHLWQDSIDEYNKRYGVQYLYLSIYRFVFAIYLEHCKKSDEKPQGIKAFINYTFSEQKQELNEIFSTLQKQKFDKKDLNKKITCDFLYRLIKAYQQKRFTIDGVEDFEDILKSTVYRFVPNDTSCEMIFLFRTMSFFKERRYNTKDQENTEMLLQLFFIYIRMKNVFFFDKVQGNKLRGLLFFSRYYSKATESKYHPQKQLHPKEDFTWYAAALKQQFKIKTLKKIEIKVTPPSIDLVPKTISGEDRGYQIAILRQLKLIFMAYNECIEKEALNGQKANIPTLGIVYHFIKQNDPDNFSGKICLFKEDRYFYGNGYYALYKKSIYFMKNIRCLIKKYPLLSEYIVGIDAAAVENQVEPWVFAPVFQESRSKATTIHSVRGVDKPIQNIGYTFHIGEEFRHILSGLRHVDEVLNHFSYHSGDRIGHGLVLGIDVEEWVANNEFVVLPIGEHLENILWIWGMQQQQNHVITHKNLDFEIMQIAEEIFPSIRGMTPYLLWKTYNRSFDGIEPREEAILKKKLKNVNKCGGYPNCIFPNEQNEISWNDYNLHCVYYCPCYFEALRKPIFVKVSSDEVTMYKELQKKIVRRVEELGVYIETNPTSNVAIGEFEGLFKHPGLNLNNREFSQEESNSVLITINSDDPLVFNTNVENEMAYLYYAMIHKKYSRELILEWIDKVRKNGMNSSFVKKTKDKDTLLKDINVLMATCFKYI